MSDRGCVVISSALSGRPHGARLALRRHQRRGSDCPGGPIHRATPVSLVAHEVAAFAPVVPTRTAVTAAMRSDTVMLAAKKKGVNPALFATGIVKKEKGWVGASARVVR